MERLSLTRGFFAYSPPQVKIASLFIYLFIIMIISHQFFFILL